MIGEELEMVFQSSILLVENFQSIVSRLFLSRTRVTNGIALGSWRVRARRNEIIGVFLRSRPLPYLRDFISTPITAPDERMAAFTFSVVRRRDILFEKDASFLSYLAIHLDLLITFANARPCRSENRDVLFTD